MSIEDMTTALPEREYGNSGVPTDRGKVDARNDPPRTNRDLLCVAAIRGDIPALLRKITEKRFIDGLAKSVGTHGRITVKDSQGMALFYRLDYVYAGDIYKVLYAGGYQWLLLLDWGGSPDGTYGLSWEGAQHWTV